MTLAYLLQQRWFQITALAVIIISLLVGIYFYGKSAGKAAAQTEFDVRQEKLLKQAQDATAAAERYKNSADIDRAIADRLKDEVAAKTKDARDNETRILNEQNTRQQEISQTYETTKIFIDSDLSACDRCRDLCQRTNRLADTDPAFAQYRRNPDEECSAVCR